MKHTCRFNSRKLNKGVILYLNVGNIIPLVVILDKAKMGEENSSFGSVLSLLLPGCCDRSCCAHGYLWCLHHLEPLSGKGLEIKEHTKTWGTLEARMPIFFCVPGQLR